MMVRATVVASAKRAVAIGGGRSAAATELKYTGKIAAVTVVTKAELAQS
jgi:hypothetical protein